MKKADRVIEAGKMMDPPWEGDLEDAGLYTLTMTRGEETMVIQWDESGSLIPSPVYTLAGMRELVLRNVSACLKQMEQPPNYKRRSAAPKREVRKPREPVRIPLPFNIDESSDEDIIKSVRGKVLTWTNSMTGDYETAQVPDRYQVVIPDGNGGKKRVWRTSKNISVKTTSTGRRVLTFPAVGEQFRSIGLDSLVQVR